MLSILLQGEAGEGSNKEGEEQGDFQNQRETIRGRARLRVHEGKKWERGEANDPSGKKKQNKDPGS